MPNWQMCAAVVPAKLTDSGQRNIGAALHVLGAGAIGSISVNPIGQRSSQSADGMDGVDMAEYQDTRPVLCLGRAMSVLRDQQVIARTMRARYAPDMCPDCFIIRGHLVGHARQGGYIIGRAFNFDPLTDPVKNLTG